MLVLSRAAHLRDPSYSSTTVFPSLKLYPGGARKLTESGNQFRYLLSPRKGVKIQRRCRWRCSADLSDAPFVLAIGACIFSSVVLAKQGDAKLEESNESEDDVRNGAMTIISFIPLFNWLGWVFAWLDTNEQRYLLYASVYLAPYVRTGFSFSTDENWLLILSFMACIAHVQLEMSAQSGGLDLGNIPFGDGLKQLQQGGKSSFLQDESRSFQESVLPKDEEASPLLEDDFSQIELEEFDKKLSGGGPKQQSVAKALEKTDDKSKEDGEHSNG